MIFQPVLHPLLLVLLLGAVAAVAVLGAVKSGSTGSRAVWITRVGLVVVCFVLLLRPGVPGGTTQTLSTDTDVILVVDTTASIVAEDWADSKPRIDGVREDVQQIVQRYPGARFALLTFDAAAQLRMPLTTDSSALISSLEVLRPETTRTSRGSSIGIASSLLTDTLKNAAAATSGADRARMVFYFGDGEQTSATTPESFASAKKYVDGGAVFGYGTTTGAPMRETTGRGDGTPAPYIQYQGKNALSKIDAANLEAIATQLGVPYAQRAADARLRLPDEPRTSTNVAQSGEKGGVIELYPAVALVALLFLAFELARAAMQVTRLRSFRAPKPARTLPPAQPPTGGGGDT